MPGLSEEHRGVARDAIASAVEKLAQEQDNIMGRFDPSMTPLEYELHCAKAFSLAGWSTTMTPKTGDQGADIVLKYHDLAGVVQCKLYGQPVGNSAVQEVIAAREYYQASIAIVVSNAAYTTAARQLAAIANVVLLHHDEIAVHSQRLGLEQLDQSV
jgi:restriction system protein